MTMKLNSLFVAMAAATVLGASSNSVRAQDSMEEVVVYGMRASLQSALDRKRDSVSMVDSIIAEDIGKFPDQNIAEAAQRIPGVQIQRYKGEGASIAIRGLKQTKTVLNGREVYGASAHAGEYNGRNFDLQDIPAELLAGVDVNKSSEADQIIGGLGGYVNIRTRRPFDFDGFKTSFSAKATYFDKAPGFESETLGQYSGLISGRLDTPLGEMGAMLNIAHADSAYGIAENEVQRTELVEDYAETGQGVVRPIGMFTGNGHHGGRNRESYVAALQWSPTENTTFTLDYFDIGFSLENDFQTARVNFGSPTSEFDLWDGSNSDGSRNLKYGVFSDSSITDTSVFGDEIRDTNLIAVKGEWDNGGPLTVKGDIANNDTDVVNTLFEWGINVPVPTSSVTLNSGRPSNVTVDGVDLLDLGNYSPQYLLAINLNGKQENNSQEVEINYDFGNGFIQSVDFGVRSSDYTRHSFGFVEFYCIDECASSQTLSEFDEERLRLVPARESQEIGPYYTFKSDVVREQQYLRNYYDLPLEESYTPDQEQLNEESTLAVYSKLNFLADYEDLSLSGNIGVRSVKTDLYGEAYGTNPDSGELELQNRNSSRDDILPSLNLKLSTEDDLVYRLGLSRTLGQVNFSYLRASTVISNQVQRDAQRGNPELDPYMSDNLDLSVEKYFEDNGTAYLGLFAKNVDGFVQTVAVQEEIDGEVYNVSTFESSGESKIRGAEIGYQKFFSGLPPMLDGLGVQLNYTYVDSESPSSVSGKTVPLEGLSEDSYNFITMYENGKVNARLAYNYRSDYVVSTSSSGAQGVPIYSDDLGTLDFSVAYNFTDQLSIVLDGVNITGESSETYYGTKQNQRNYLPLNSRYGLQIRYSY